MSNTKIDLNKGYHQVLSVSGEDAHTIIGSITSEQNEMKSFQSELHSLLSNDAYSISPNHKVIDEKTGLANDYIRLMNDQPQEVSNLDFSEKQTLAFTNDLSNVEAKIDGQPTKLIEQEIREMEKDISSERERLQDLENQFVNIQNALIQSLQRTSPEQDNTRSVEKTKSTEPQTQSPPQPNEEKKKEQEQISAQPTAGHAFVSGITTAGRSLARGISSLLSEKKDSKPITPWINQPSKKMSIPEQCQNINKTISKITDSEICSNKGIADELFKTLSKDLISLNQSMSKESKSFFAKSHKTNAPQGESLLKDMGHVDEMLTNLGKKSPELNGVMEKFGVKIDMNSIKESMSTMVNQMKDILNKALNKSTNNSMEMNT